MTKKPTLETAASLMGRKGGKSRSPEKSEASRQNAAKARAAALAKRRSNNVTSK